MTDTSPSTSTNATSRSEPDHEQVKEIETEQLLKSVVSMKYPSDLGLYASTISDNNFYKFIV